MSTADLTALAMRMGLEGAELKAWIEEREARAREERAAEREAKKEQLELQLRIEERGARARGERAAERVAKKEEMELQLRIEEQAQRTIQLRLEFTQTEATREPVVADIGRAARVSSNVNPHNFIPGFDETRDDLDAYLKRFENVAMGPE